MCPCIVSATNHFSPETVCRVMSHFIVRTQASVRPVYMCLFTSCLIRLIHRHSVLYVRVCVRAYVRVCVRKDYR